MASVYAERRLLGEGEPVEYVDLGAHGFSLRLPVHHLPAVEDPSGHPPVSEYR